MIRVCGIYGWRCTESGKWYVGQSINISRRRLEHLSMLRNGKNHNSHLQGAFNKYGEESFEFHILEEVPENMMDVRERAWISYLKSTDRQFGYNIDSGGNLNRHFSEETRAKLSALQRGRVRTPEMKVRMGRANIGRHPSPETRKKLSESHKGKHYEKLSEAMKKWWASRRALK